MLQFLDIRLEHCALETEESVRAGELLTILAFLSKNDESFNLVYATVCKFIKHKVEEIVKSKDRTSAYRSLQKDIVESFVAVLIITDRIQDKLEEILSFLCNAEGYVEALLHTLEGSCSEKSAFFTSLCLSHNTLKTAISKHFTDMTVHEGGAYKVQQHLASLGLEREVLLNYIKSEVENRVGGSLKVLSMQHLLELNEDEDEALFFECWTMPGPGGFTDDENAVNN